MSRLVNLINNLRFILKHPLNQGQSVSTILRIIQWQCAFRLVASLVVMNWVGNTRLLVGKNLTGANGNLYCGLHEFEDMAFVMHALHPGDLFVDVGANIGSYSILAAGVARASVVAIEPVPATFAILQDNIRLNRIESLVSAFNMGLGSKPGKAHFTENEGAANHLVNIPCDGLQHVEVPLETLDNVLHNLNPTVIKIDVEGYEQEIVKGSNQSFCKDSLLAVLLELQGVGDRYGFDEMAVHQEMLRQGFTPCRYQPLSRMLTPLKHKNALGNTLYVRHIDALQERLLKAEKLEIHGRFV